MGLMDSKKLVFLHIPKTAGSSFGRFLDSQFEQRQIAKIYAGKNIDQQLKAALANDTIKLIRGHFGFYESLQNYPREKLFIATILRKPSHRVLSLYNHLQKSGSTTSSLSEFLEEGIYQNEQTRYLSGYHTKTAFKKNEEEALAKAIDFLNRIDFVSDSNALDEDIKALHRQMEWRTSNHLNTENKGQNSALLYARNMLYEKKISNYEHLDNALYQVFLQHKNIEQ